MARTDPLTAALLLSHPHHHKHHSHHHHKVKVPSGGTQDFHLGSFHHHVTGTEIGMALVVIVVIAAIAAIAAGLRS